MARVTVEDCVLKVPNRFDLVLRAAQRSRGIAAGAPLTLDRDNDKNAVVSLREIAEGLVLPEDLEESLIYSHQKYREVDEPEEDGSAMLLGGEDVAEVTDEISEDALASALAELNESVNESEAENMGAIRFDDDIVADD